tara:strand:+ start:856 stop:1236 length:381 start_codon:yes stop_codon:yes gene_type:complete
MEKTAIYGFAIFLMIVGGGYFMLQGSEGGGVNGNAVKVNGDVQEVVIGMKNYNYDPKIVEVEVGKPVRIRLDKSVFGCFRDFTIRDLGVRKYLQSPNDYVEFIPENPGSYTFACSMGMGVGRLIVE